MHEKSEREREGSYMKRQNNNKDGQLDTHLIFGTILRVHEDQGAQTIIFFFFSFLWLDWHKRDLKKIIINSH
jgi:ABC-type Mn2+/Zn2+ transport system permease subunit